jgi:hypothetical protein
LELKQKSYASIVISIKPMKNVSCGVRTHAQ